MGEPQTQIRPLQLSNATGSTVLKDITAPFGDPAAIGENDFYSFSTWRLRIRVKANRTVVAAVSFTPESTTNTCSSDPNDIDCRLTQLDNITDTRCVPFFKDPSAPGDGSLNPYRCAYYRVKDVPVCSAGPASCPFDEAFVLNSTDILAEVILNLTNPPSSVFNINALFGNGVKGNPRLARDPDSIPGNQFGIDSTTAVIDWPAFGSGFPNDYSPVQRATSNPGSCAEIVKPDKGKDSGSVMVIEVHVKTGPVVNGHCTGNPITGAATSPNKMTLAIAGTGSNNTLIIFCKEPGNTSNKCFREKKPGEYHANVELDPSAIPPDAVNPYVFAVTSVNDPNATGPQNPGIFPPTSRQYFVCPIGGNCGG